MVVLGEVKKSIEPDSPQPFIGPPAMLVQLRDWIAAKDEPGVVRALVKHPFIECFGEGLVTDCGGAKGEQADDAVWPVGFSQGRKGGVGKEAREGTSQAVAGHIQTGSTWQLGETVPQYFADFAVVALAWIVRALQERSTKAPEYLHILSRPSDVLAILVGDQLPVEVDEYVRERVYLSAAKHHRGKRASKVVEEVNLRAALIEVLAAYTGRMELAEPTVRW